MKISAAAPAKPQKPRKKRAQWKPLIGARIYREGEDITHLCRAKYDAANSIVAITMPPYEPKIKVTLNNPDQCLNPIH